jgi:hypothetical protein
MFVIPSFVDHRTTTSGIFIRCFLGSLTVNEGASLEVMGKPPLLRQKQLEQSLRRHSYSACLRFDPEAVQQESTANILGPVLFPVDYAKCVLT